MQMWEGGGADVMKGGDRRTHRYASAAPVVLAMALSLQLFFSTCALSRMCTDTDPLSTT